MLFARQAGTPVTLRYAMAATSSSTVSATSA
jgi:hypothetical protein